LLAFLIALGAFGMRLAGQYLLMAVWIQLWMPVLAIINLYINLVATQQMAALSGIAGFDPTSMAGLAQMQLDLADWLATGSLLAAMTPAIAMFLVWGGSVAATAVAGRLQSGDFIQEKATAPDVMQPAAALSLNPGYQHDLVRGTYATGAPETVLPRISPDLAAAQSVAAARGQQQEAVASYQSTLSGAFRQGWSSQRSAFEGNQWTDRLATSSSRADQYLYSNMEAVVRATNERYSTLSGIQSEAGLKLNATQGLNALAGKDYKLDLLGAGAKATYGVSEEYAQLLNQEARKQFGSQETMNTEMATALSQDKTGGRNSVYEQQLGLTHDKTLQQAKSDVYRETQEYSERLEQAKRLSTSGAWELGAVAQRLQQRPDLAQRIDESIRLMGWEADAMRLAGPEGLYGRMLPNPQQAQLAASVGLLVGWSQPSRPGAVPEARDELAMNTLLQVQQAMEGPGLALGAPKPLALPEPLVPGATRQAVQGAGLRDPEGATRNLPGQVGAAFAQQDRQLADMPGRIGDANQVGRREIEFQNAGQGYQAAQDQLAEARRRVAAAADQPVEADAAQFPRELWDSAKDIAILGGTAIGGFAGGGFAGSADAIQAQREGLKAEALKLNLGPAAAEYYSMTRLPVFSSDAADKARQAVLQELKGDPAAQQVVELIERAGRIGDPETLRQVGDLYQAREAVQEARKSAGQINWSSAPASGAPLPTPAAFQQAGAKNPNAEYQAIQQRANPALLAHFAQLEASRGLPAGILTAVAIVESSFTNNATSPVGAAGMFQLMPGTVQRYNVQNPRDPYEASRGAADYLKFLNDRYGNTTLMIAGYNAGEGNMDKYRDVPPFTETRQFVDKVTTYLRSIQSQM